MSTALDQKTPSSPPSESPSSGEASWLALSLWTSVALGISLRVWGAGSQHVLQDEIHTVDVVAYRSFGWIATHFGVFDHSIPYSLYAKLAAHSIGLDEWTLRLPSIVAGCLALVLVALGSRRLLRPSEAALTTGVFALSPYLVYLSREARPYSIVLLCFTLACGLGFAWLRDGGRGRIVASGVLLVVAAWFHPVVLPSAGAFTVALLLLSLRSRSEPRISRDLWWAAGIAAALFALLLGPALPDLLDQRSWRAGAGAFDLSRLRAGLMLLHGTPVHAPLIVALAIGALGCARLAERHPKATATLAAATAVQLAVIWIEQPVMAEHTFVWFRYVAQLLPFLIAVLAAPLAWGLDALAQRAGRPALGLALSAALVWIYAAAQLSADHYALGSGHANNMHPWILYLNAGRQSESIRPPSAFYESPMAPGATSEAIIEAPLLTLFPLYSIYQRVHGQRVYAGVTREGFRQPLFVAERGFDFQQTIDLEDLTPETRRDADLLIWHKKIQEEMFRGMSAVFDSWPASLHSPPRARFREFAVHEFGPRGPALPRVIRERFRVLYEDEFITVFDLRTRMDEPGEPKPLR